MEFSYLFSKIFLNFLFKFFVCLIFVTHNEQIFFHKIDNLFFFGLDPNNFMLLYLDP